MTVPQEVKLARHAQYLDDDGKDIAENVTYDPTASGLVATDVQAAIDELASGTGSSSGGGSGVPGPEGPEGPGGPPGPPGPAGFGAGAFSGVIVTTPAVGDRLRFDGSSWVNSRLAWMPVMVNDPVIVTTDGLAVYVPLVTSDGQPVMVESLT